MDRRVLLLVPDLFFSTRIVATARALGVAVEAVTAATLVDRCAAEPPDLVIADLHAPGDPLVALRDLKAGARTRTIPIVGFYSHVDRALRTAALEAGVDQVLPRSAFTTKLAALLAGEATPPAGS